MEVVKTEDLKKSYELPSGSVHALDGVSIRIHQGDFIAVVGSSVSVKTTLLNMLGGLDVPTSGKIWIHGKRMDGMRRDELTVFRRRNIGFVFQNYNLVPILSVGENITLPLKLDGVSPDTAYLRHVIQSLKIEDKLDAMPHMLSGGQQQRVAIARALSMKPALILADEPTGSLDSVTGIEVVGLLKASAQAFNQTIVVVTHNEEIAQLADRIIRIEDGRVGGGKDEE